jgi:hypothetical protein
MIVNVQNYETYFLLYIDNELSATEKATVELFIQQNPSYQQELTLLQNAKLGFSENTSEESAEEKIIFEDKLSLYQISESDTTCLLYLEHEMLASEVAQFEEKLAKDPHLQISLSNWRKTLISQNYNELGKNEKGYNEIGENEKLDPAFKYSLYKKEAELISIKAKPLWEWNNTYRIASVAALLILWWGYQWLYTSSMISKKEMTPNVIVVNPVQTNNTAISNKSLEKNAEDINNRSQASLTNSSVISKSSPSNSLVKSYNTTSIAKNVLANNTIQVPERMTESQRVTFDNRINELKNDLTNANESKNTRKNESIAKENESIVNENARLETTEAAKLIPVSYKEVDLHTEEEERTLYIGNLELDAAKFREISRKLTAIFKRNRLEKEK